MLEIEIKFSAADFASIQTHLQAWGATAQPAIDEVDHYFNAPDRDFAQTDEAFRLRCIGDNNRITYKGPKQGGPTKTRTEIELAIEPGAAAAESYRRLVQHLGYRPTAVVTKRRTIYDFARDGFDLQACLDEVETLGRVCREDRDRRGAGRRRNRAAGRVAAGGAMNWGLPQSEPRSYLEMVLARSARGRSGCLH